MPNQPQPAPPQRGGLWSFTFMPLAVGTAMLALILAVVGFWLPGGGSGRSVTAANAPSKPLTVEVSLKEFSVTPAKIEVAAGQKMVLKVTNHGTMAHDLKVDGKDGTAMLDPGKSETVELQAPSASTEAWCTVAGHKEAGMVMKIEVKGSSGGGEVAAAAAPAAKGATIDPNAAPGPDFKPYDPNLQPAPVARSTT